MKHAVPLSTITELQAGVRDLIRASGIEPVLALAVVAAFVDQYRGGLSDRERECFARNRTRVWMATAGAGVRA